MRMNLATVALLLASPFAAHVPDAPPIQNQPKRGRRGQRRAQVPAAPKARVPRRRRPTRTHAELTVEDIACMNAAADKRERRRLRNLRWYPHINRPGGDQ